MYLLTNVHMIPMQLLSPHVPSTQMRMRNYFHVARLMNTLMKMASNSRSNLCEILSFHSI